MMNKIVFFLLFFILFFACSGRDSRLKKTLVFAGKNRKELEKVLEHYKNDPEKLMAARFLIENMCYYNSFENEKFDLYKKEIRKITCEKDINTEDAWKYLEEIHGKIPLKDYVIKNDAEYITSEYLINNIDWSFKVWKKQPWGKHVSFELFCEEILPYRINNEPLEDWREIYYNYFQPVLDSLLTDHNPVTACDILHDTICKQEWFFSQDLPTPHLGSKTLLEERFGNCREYSDLVTYAMRALGIPGGIDIILQNPDNISKKHYWNYVRDTIGTTVEFELFGLSPNYQHANGKRGKIYRCNYGIQKNNLWIRHPQNDIPSSLKDPFISDVSNEYFSKNSIGIDISKKEKKDNILYLSVFNNLTWIPVSWAEIKSGKAVFVNLEPNIVFAPTFYIKGENIIAGTPFSIKENGEIRYFIPNETNTIEITVYRKYRPGDVNEKVKEISLGGKFQVANNIAFSNCIDLHTITEGVEPYYHEINTNCKEKYQFIRYLSSDKGFHSPKRMFRINEVSYCNIAELEAYTSNDVELKGTIIGTDGTTRNNPQHTKHVVFDKNPLTFFESDKSKNSWVGLDFGEPKQIEKIRFLFRNDDNNIREGDLYELFYFSKEQGKVSLGRQIGNRKQRLTYTNVPENALLWLHNHTRGREERPFTYENGEQVWW